MVAPVSAQPAGKTPMVKPGSGVSTSTTSASVAEFATVIVRVYSIVWPTSTSVSAAGLDDLATLTTGAATGVTMLHVSAQVGGFGSFGSPVPTTALSTVP